MVFEGHLVGTGLKVGVVVGRFNEFITSKLLGGALDGLKRHGVEKLISMLLGFLVPLKFL